MSGGSQVISRRDWGQRQDFFDGTAPALQPPVQSQVDTAHASLSDDIGDFIARS